MVEW
jgi:hypothetical protein